MNFFKILISVLLVLSTWGSRLSRDEVPTLTTPLEGKLEDEPPADRLLIKSLKIEATLSRDATCSQA